MPFVLLSRKCSWPIGARPQEHRRDPSGAPEHGESTWVRLQGLVDWFSFWLQGKEDPDPAKGDQYAIPTAQPAFGPLRVTTAQECLGQIWDKKSTLAQILCSAMLPHLW